MRRTKNAARRVRTPLRFQLEARECGAVALGIVLAYYGCHVPLAELRQRCTSSRDGVRVDAIVRAARSYGLTVHVYKRNTIRSLPRPFIMYWNFNHFLVVEGFRGDHVLVNDPAFGHRIIAPDDFNRFYSGLVLTFEPNDTFRPQGHPYSALTMLVSLLRQRAALVLLLMGGVQAVPNLLARDFSNMLLHLDGCELNPARIQSICFRRQCDRGEVVSLINYADKLLRQ